MGDKYSYNWLVSTVNLQVVGLGMHVLHVVVAAERGRLRHFCSAEVEVVAGSFNV